MTRHRLTDEQWKLIADVFPPPAQTGRPPSDRRMAMDAILWILRAGSPWRDLPKEESKKLPRYPVPVVHLARLAVHRGESGKGLGVFLLVDGLGRSLRASEEVGAFAMEVIAKNDSAKRFYEKYGFRELADDRRHLYLSMKKLKILFHQS